jgi:hypothetical protein
MANTAKEENIIADKLTVSSPDVMPEMYRKTMAAFCTLVPIPYMSCWSKPAVAACDIKIKELDETKNPSEEEVVEKAKEEATPETMTPLSDASAWVLKPSVGTWLMPLPTKEEAYDEAALKAFESSLPADSELKAVNVDKVQRKGLGARAKKWLCCVQASAAEPKSLKPKSPKASKAPKAPKATKATKATKASKTPKTAKTDLAKAES